MAQITKPVTLTDSTTANADDVNQNFDTIYNEFNGNIEDANIKTGAAISLSKVPNTDRFRVFNSASYPKQDSGASYHLKFNSVAFDPKSGWSTGDGEYTVPTAGVWFLTAQVFSYQGGSTSPRRTDVFILKNGASMAIGSNRTVTAHAGLTVNVGGAYYLEAGDKLKVTGRIDYSAGAPYFYGDASGLYSFFSGHLLSV